MLRPDFKLVPLRRLNKPTLAPFFSNHSTLPANISLFMLDSQANILASNQPCCICSVSHHFNFCLLCPPSRSSPPCWPRRHCFMARGSDLPEVAFFHIKQAHFDKQEGRKGSVRFWKTQQQVTTLDCFQLRDLILRHFDGLVDHNVQPTLPALL